MNYTAIADELHTFLEDAQLVAPANFHGRARALALTDLALEYIRYGRQREDLAALQLAAARLRQRVQKTNDQVIQFWRKRIQAGTCAPAALTQFCMEVAGPLSGSQLHIAPTGLDEFINGLLDIGEQPGETRPREREMIQYEAAPASVILELAQEVTLSPGSVFYDLGAGLGIVVILFHLLTRAVSKGVEIEPAYYQAAVLNAARLNLECVSFINADARDLTYADGGLFFMFTPFKGQIMRDVLHRLYGQAGTRPITVATFGYCTLEVAAAPWLQQRHPAPLHPFRLTLFDSA
ncbi:MAG: hypothetical protein Fur0021_01760 [Candidatus Promineifilaceae bacterium]